MIISRISRIISDYDNLLMLFAGACAVIRAFGPPDGESGLSSGNETGNCFDTNLKGFLTGCRPRVILILDCAVSPPTSAGKGA